MPDCNFVLLYVADPAASAAFYAALFDREPAEHSPAFAMFVLDSGFKLGLWARHDVVPTLPASAGTRGDATGELIFAVADRAAVATTHADWSRRGLPIVQAPVDMDFGYTFTALDPDGHRLRVYARSAA